jgi:hypothetical protein
MINLPIPETIESVTRPVMLDVIRQLMGLTGISKKTNIVYFGDVERSKQLNSAIGADVEKDDPNTFAHNDKITVEVAESYYGDMGHNDAVERPENLLVFQDAPLSVIMKPIYAQMEATVSIKYRANNKTAAQQWRDYVKARMTQKRELYIHNVTYAFGIPEELLYILKEIHRLRENVAGYGEDFDTYFESHRTPKMTMLTNLSGTAELWAVPETQTRIQGWFDWETPEETQKEGDTGPYTISFNYKFRYARPTAIEMTYPIMVHNQMLDKKFRDVPMQDHTDVEKSYSMTARIFHSLEGSQWSDKQVQDFGFSIPAFDEFWPRMTPISTQRLLTILFTLDDTNPHQFLNLADLKSRKFNADILAYMKAERDYLALPGMSAINLALYKNEFLIANDPPPFKVDENLNVVGLLSTNYRVQHHLRVSLFTDWQSLRGGALTRLQDHGRAAIMMLMAIDPSLKTRGFLPALIDDNFVSKTSLLIAVNNLRPVRTPVIHGPTGLMMTVQTLFAETSHA